MKSSTSAPHSSGQTTGNLASTLMKMVSGRSVKPTEIEETTMERYQSLDNELQNLVSALQRQHDSLVQYRKAEQEVFSLVNNLARGSPLAAPLEGTATPSSLTSVGQALENFSIPQENAFEETVVDYAIEWQKLVTRKFTTELNALKEARGDVMHYTKKVGNLDAAIEKKAGASEEISIKKADKAERNHDKLERAERECNKHEKYLSILLDKFVDQAWKDLFPFLVKYLECTLNITEGRAKILPDLQHVLKGISDVASSQGIQEGTSDSTDLWRKFRSEWREMASSVDKTDMDDEHRPDVTDATDDTEGHADISETPETRNEEFPTRVDNFQEATS